MQYLKKKANNGCWIKFALLDLNRLFKQRDRDWWEKHDCSVYFWLYKGTVYYIGHGRLDMNNWQEGRQFHIGCNDMLSNTIDSRWTCEIIHGLTKKEARILEAYFISIAQRPFSKIGTYVWDGVSLINKRREVNYKKNVPFKQLFKEYLNLDGNNYWETFRRKINGY